MTTPIPGMPGPDPDRRDPTEVAKGLMRRESPSTFAWFNIIMWILIILSLLGAVAAPCDPDWLKGGGSCPQIGFIAFSLLMGAIYLLGLVIAAVVAIARSVVRRKRAARPPRS